MRHALTSPSRDTLRQSVDREETDCARHRTPLRGPQVQTRRLQGIHGTAWLVASLWVASGAAAETLCEGYGPQTPRDIASPAGHNSRIWTLAPKPQQMNLCNIHTHTNAEHKGPGFSVYAGDGKFGGYRCNETAALTAEELADPWDGKGPFGNVKPGDTIEVHWVYTSCDLSPGEGLGSCMSPACSNPELRVEAQAFLLVNDPEALDFRAFDYAGAPAHGLHQPKALPSGTGRPVVFAGSTTGPSFSQEKCSPLQVTWSVRPYCARLDVNSLHAWAQSTNVFKEVESHGVRPLVTAPELLSEITGPGGYAGPASYPVGGSPDPGAPGTFGAPYPPTAPWARGPFPRWPAPPPAPWMLPPSGR